MCNINDSFVHKTRTLKQGHVKGELQLLQSSIAPVNFLLLQVKMSASKNSYHIFLIQFFLN